MSQQLVSTESEDCGSYFAVRYTYDDGTTVDGVEWKPGMEPPTTVAVEVDPQALSNAQAAITAATTIAGLRKAVSDALNLLNPGT